MTGHTIAAMRRVLRYSRPEMAALLGASETAIRRWEATGEDPPPMEPRFEDILSLLHEELHRDQERVCTLLHAHRRDGLRSLYLLLSLRYGAASLDPSPLARSPVGL